MLAHEKSHVYLSQDYPGVIFSWYSYSISMIFHDDMLKYPFYRIHSQDFSMITKWPSDIHGYPLYIYIYICSLYISTLYSHHIFTICWIHFQMPQRYRALLNPFTRPSRWTVWLFGCFTASWAENDGFWIWDPWGFQPKMMPNKSVFHADGTYLIWHIDIW